MLRNQGSNLPMKSESPQKLRNLTVFIPVKNEGARIEKCLAAIGDWARVIVVDSGSADNTAEVALDFGAEVLNFEWNGRFPKKRNWALENVADVTEWVLFIDADEIVSKDFKQEVEEKISRERYDGFWLNYDIYFENRKLHYGIGQRKLALFKSHFRYQKSFVDLSDPFDMEIHEQPSLNFKNVGNIRSKIDHEDPNDYKKFIEKHIAYARWEATNHSKHVAGYTNEALSFRQKIKSHLIGLSVFPVLYFFFAYFIKLGFLDGKQGLSYAIYKIWYFNLIRQLIEMEEQNLRL